MDIRHPYKFSCKPSSRARNVLTNVTYQASAEAAREHVARNWWILVGDVELAAGMPSYAHMDGRVVEILLG